MQNPSRKSNVLIPSKICVRHPHGDNVSFLNISGPRPSADSAAGPEQFHLPFQCTMCPRTDASGTIRRASRAIR